MAKQDHQTEQLPARVVEYIDLVVRKMRYRRRVRQDVRRELAAHFHDALADCKDDTERNALADELIKQFGQPKLLAKLIRRGKKRCRSWWRKAIIHTFQSVGVLVLLVGLRVAFLGFGSPTITVNYLERLNELARQGKDESLNGKDYFDRAVELATADKSVLFNRPYYLWHGEMSEQDRQIVAKFLADNAESLDMLRAAAAKPDFWFEYRGDPDLQKGNFIGSVMPLLSEYRHMAGKLGAAIMRQAYQGDVTAALDDALLLRRLGIHLQGKGLLPEQISGIALEVLGLNVMARVLAKRDVPADVLLSIQHTLEREYARTPSPISLAVERVFWYDYMQRTFTDDGKGGGRMLAKGLPFVVSGWQDAVHGFFLGYPDRREVLARIEMFFEQSERRIAKTPWKLRQERLVAGKNHKAVQASIMLDLLKPAHDRTGELGWRLKADRGAVVTIMALKRWRLTEGAFPEKISELVITGYLQTLPDDPYSDGPLKYERRGDDFVLYSFGGDFDDDGGSQHPDDPWGEDDAGGDHVFWPVY